MSAAMTSTRRPDSARATPSSAAMRPEEIFVSAQATSKVRRFRRTAMATSVARSVCTASAARLSGLAAVTSPEKERRPTPIQSLPGRVIDPCQHRQRRRPQLLLELGRVPDPVVKGVPHERQDQAEQEAEQRAEYQYHLVAEPGRRERQRGRDKVAATVIVDGKRRELAVGVLASAVARSADREVLLRGRGRRGRTQLCGQTRDLLLSGKLPAHSGPLSRSAIWLASCLAPKGQVGLANAFAPACAACGLLAFQVICSTLEVVNVVAGTRRSGAWPPPPAGWQAGHAAAGPPPRSPGATALPPARCSC